MAAYKAVPRRAKFLALWTHLMRLILLSMRCFGHTDSTELRLARNKNDNNNDNTDNDDNNNYNDLTMTITMTIMTMT